mgnify:CR=1 FL=1
MENLTHSDELALVSIFIITMFGLMLLVCYGVYKDAQEEIKKNK